jgi:hypothetical protein
MEIEQIMTTKIQKTRFTLVLPIAVAMLVPGCMKQNVASAPPAGTGPSQQLTKPLESAEQVHIPTSPAEVPVPVPGIEMTQAYVEAVGQMAYIWGYPLVNMHNRRRAFSQAPSPGLLGGTVPFAPPGYNAMLTNYIKPEQKFIVCPNQDVTYGAGFTQLEKEPTVFQVPDFGDRFWVYALYDSRSDEIAQIGQQYGTKPGFYMIVGAHWDGEVPEGITSVVRSSTELVFTVPRIYKDDTPEDSQAVLPLVSQVMFYPLSEYDGKMKTTDWTKLPHFPAPPAGDGGESKWVKPNQFFEHLEDAMELVPPLPGEEALYAWIHSVWDAASEDPKLKAALVESFVTAEKEIIHELFSFRHLGLSVGNGWTAPSNASQFGIDYLNRTAISKSSKFQNTPAETQYQFKEIDSNGQEFSGANQYSITFKETPPVNGFWSLTLYNDKHFFEPNKLGRYSLGTKNKSLKYNEDGSLTLYLGNKSPGKDKESNWIPAPQGTFSLLLRHYWPKGAVLSGDWQPPEVVKL